MFNTHGIVVFTGPPGCGKTMAAMYLIRKTLLDSEFRKIHSFEELSYINDNTRYLVFIDNIFLRRTGDPDLESWWHIFDKIHGKYFASHSAESKVYPLRIVMTTRSNVIETACNYIGKVTPILNEEFRINASKLEEKEKAEILKKQIQFAKEAEREHIPVLNDSFINDVKKREGPIGFPLCAHLYAFTKEYQQSGAIFFSRPIEYLTLQIKDEIKSDKTNRTKSLFFFLFFFEWHSKVDKMEKLDLENGSSCKRFLTKISPNLITNFEPFDFNGLEDIYKKLSGAFFKEVGEGGEHKYTFEHESVREAVGAYFCEAYFIETVKHFPLDIIKIQVYENLNEIQKYTLAARLLYEALDQQLSQVFACKIFKNEEFSIFFNSKLQKKDNYTVDLLLTMTNKSSTVKLPTIFWTSRYDIFPLTELLYEFVKEREISPDYQLYVMLFGMCCAKREGMLKTVNGMFQDNIEKLQNYVLAFTDDENNYIPHIVIASKGSDKFALNVLKKIFQKEQKIAAQRNKNNMTLLMLAVEQKLPRASVIDYLMSTPENGLHRKDTNNSNIFHHLLRSENDDETCAEYINMILSDSNATQCLRKDDINGDAALHIAAKEIKHSRIWSMLKLLDSGKCIVDSLNQKGCSPLHLSASSLKEDTPYHKLECCTRVIILLLYDANPKKQTDKNHEPIDECIYDGVKTILSKSSDKETMKNVLDGYLKDMEQVTNCKGIKQLDLGLNKPIAPGILPGISKAVQYLKNIEFEKSAYNFVV